MIRTVIAVMIMLCLAAGSALAQGLSSNGGAVRQALKATFASPAVAPAASSAPAPKVTLARVAPALAAAPAARAKASGGKSFWKTPWPYVIGVGVVVSVVVAKHNGGLGGY